MFSTSYSAVLCGIESCLVCVEADVSNGLPAFQMVGYLSSEVREAQERVRTAIRNSGILLPPKKVTINLSPADLRKEGSGFDLPIAAAVLAAYGYFPKEELEHIFIVGELSLSGEINSIKGILSFVDGAKKVGYHRCMIPKENEKEGAMISGIEVIGVSNLGEMIRYFQGKEKIKPCTQNEEERWELEEEEDFCEVNGQEILKRGAEIAVSGMHHFLMIGPPGSGKSMIAKRIPSILPDMTLEESLEISKIYSVSGLLSQQSPLLRKRPFRAPHHTITPQALIGGGRNPKPGEISLAHRGILFLDELTEFQKMTLEVLRQPLEDKKVCISRIGGRYIFPANTMLLGAMNPCKCGYYPDRERCSCTEREVRRYLQKLSHPFLDRMDISVKAEKISYRDLQGEQKRESSRQIKERVLQAHNRQKKRYKGTRFMFNSDLNAAGIKEYCIMTSEASRLLEQSFEKLKISARSYHKLIKVAQTAADLEGAKKIEKRHIAEAILYRIPQNIYE